MAEPAVFSSCLFSGVFIFVPLRYGERSGCFLIFFLRHRLACIRCTSLIFVCYFSFPKKQTPTLDRTPHITYHTHVHRSLAFYKGRHNKNLFSLCTHSPTSYVLFCVFQPLSFFFVPLALRFFLLPSILHLSSFPFTFVVTFFSNRSFDGLILYAQSFLQFSNKKIMLQRKNAGARTTLVCPSCIGRPKMR